MQKTLIAATIATLTSAFDLSVELPGENEGRPDLHIVYPDGETDSVRIDPNTYPAVFAWPEGSRRCGATMVSPRMALTAGHCIRDYEESSTNLDMQIQLTDGSDNYSTYNIVDIRTNERWWSGDFCSGMKWYSNDIAILVLDRDITPNGGSPIEGTHYVKPWVTEDDGSIVGEKFILAGWGWSGEVGIEGDDSD
jgi:V8-like Glu-specific endopeptidase